jgi:outer membrane protein
MTPEFKKIGLSLALSLIANSAIGAAQAQDRPATSGVTTLNFGSSPDTQPDWIVTLGVGTEFGPSYEGAKRTGFSFMPSDLSIRRAGEPDGFSAPDDGFNYTLFEWGNFSFGPVGNYRSGRYLTDDHRLTGLHSIASTVDAGGFAEYWILADRLRTRVEVRQALRAREGLVADLSADWVQPYGAFTASLGPRLSVGNGTYMRSWFGVTSQEAAASPFVGAFHASAGVKSFGAMAALRYTFSPSWSGTVYDGFQRLVGDAASSPITSRIGSRNQNTVGLSLTYSFGVKFH